MNSTCERRSAADMRERQKQNLAQASAVQPTVAVMEHNWKALITSLNTVVETETQILERLAPLATKEELISLMGEQIDVLREYQDAAMDVQADYLKMITASAESAQKMMQSATNTMQVRSGEVSESFSKVICEEQKSLREWMIRCLLISLIPGAIQVVLLLTQLI